MKTAADVVPSFEADPTKMNLRMIQPFKNMIASNKMTQGEQVVYTDDDSDQLRKKIGHQKQQIKRNLCLTSPDIHTSTLQTNQPRRTKIFFSIYPKFTPNIQWTNC